MEYISAKTIVTNTKNREWFGAEFNMNIYRGCPHGCIYCDSRSDCYRNSNFDTVCAKKDALEIVKNDLRRKVKKGVIATGSMSDPYNPFEEKLQLTRNSLKLINTYGFGVAVATKSNLVVRDIDVFKDIKLHSPVIIKITITTACDSLAEKIEPFVSKSSERFQALKTLSENGIFCGVLMMPLLPFINDTKENVVKILQLAKENGAKFVYPSFGVTLRDSQRDYFYKKLEETECFKGLQNKYMKSYGTSYYCNNEKLNTVFVKECERLSLLYKMKDIIKSYKQSYETEQLSLL